jgi:hypothetical protein
MRLNKKLSFAAALTTLGLLALTLSTAYANSREVGLTPTSGSLTPNSSGTAEWSFSNGVISGKFEVQNLPTQG